MRRLTLLLLLLLFILGTINCQSINRPHSSDQTANAQYFPDRAFDQNEEDNDFYVDWYTEHLIALKEPSLYKFSKESKLQCYRILVLPAFQAPVSFRIMVSAYGSGSLIIKKTNGKGGYAAGKLVKNFTIQLTKKQLDEFLSKLDKTYFWELTPHKPLAIEEYLKREYSTNEAGFVLEEITLDGAV